MAPFSSCRGQSLFPASSVAWLHHKSGYGDHQSLWLVSFDAQSLALFHPGGSPTDERHIEIFRSWLPCERKCVVLPICPWTSQDQHIRLRLAFIWSRLSARLPYWANESNLPGLVCLLRWPSPGPFRPGLLSGKPDILANPHIWAEGRSPICHLGTCLIGGGHPGMSVGMQYNLNWVHLQIRIFRCCRCCSCLFPPWKFSLGLPVFKPKQC